MTKQSLYERIYAECEKEHLDQVAIKAICDQHDKLLANLVRANEILSLNVLPENHWAAPDDPDDYLLEDCVRAMELWSEPSETIYESGVIVDQGFSQEDCDEFNRESMNDTKILYKAMRDKYLERRK